MQNRDKTSKESKSVAKEYIYNGYSFIIPAISKTGVSLIPKPYFITKCTYNSKILKDLHSVWDINKFNVARTPLEIGEISDPNSFRSPIIRVLDMPIKLSGSNEYRIPNEIVPFFSTIQQIVNFEHSILSEEQLLPYHAYLTIDQSDVQTGAMQRKPGAHVDGFQGARIFPKTIINHSYVVSNGTPTVFYPQSFNFAHLDERIHDCFLEMDVQANEGKAIKTKPYMLYLMDAYTVHRAEIATENCFRTFVRISYDVKEFDRLGNTINPLLPYAWEMIPREAHSTLIRYQPLNDYEKELISSTNFEVLGSYISKLKNSNLERYYNFSYTGLQARNVDIIKLILKKLSESKSTIQELRLIFIAATRENLEISHFAKKVFITQLQHAKDHIKNNLFLDFILEIVTQKPGFLSKKILTELMSGQEHTPQGKGIIKSMKNISNSTSQNRSLNSSYFWKIPSEISDKDSKSFPQLRAKL